MLSDMMLRNYVLAIGTHRGKAAGIGRERFGLQTAAGMKEGWVWLNFPWEFYEDHQGECQRFLRAVQDDLRMARVSAVFQKSGGGLLGIEGALKISPNIQVLSVFSDYLQQMGDSRGERLSMWLGGKLPAEEAAHLVASMRLLEPQYLEYQMRG